MIIRDSYLNKVSPFAPAKLVKLLTGMRGAGKTALLHQIRDQRIREGTPPANCFFYNFEDPRLRPLCNAPALHEAVLKDVEGRTGRCCLFFDEIQYVNDWQACINSLRAILDSDIYVAATDANVIDSPSATLLTGRFIHIDVLPPGLSEWLPAYLTAHPDTDRATASRFWLHSGGLPAVLPVAGERAASEARLAGCLQTILGRDLAAARAVRDIPLLEALLTEIGLAAGDPVSATELAERLRLKGFQASVTTVTEYLRKCTEACLLAPVPRTDLRTGRRIKTREKWFFGDHGLLSITVPADKLRLKAVLENAVFLELRRRGCDVTAGQRDHTDVCLCGNNLQEKCYVTVLGSLEAEDDADAVFSRLLDIRDNYPKFIVSADPISFCRQGIRHMNIYDFLQGATF